MNPINIAHTSRLSDPCWHPPICEPLHTQTTNAQAQHSIDKHRVKNLTLLPSTVPCGKVLVWQSPVALAIRQGRLISPSEIHGGSADRLNKQQVSLPTGELELHMAAQPGSSSEAGEGQTGALQRAWIP